MPSGLRTITYAAILILIAEASSAGDAPSQCNAQCENAYSTCAEGCVGPDPSGGVPHCPINRPCCLACIDSQDACAKRCPAAQPPPPSSENPAARRKREERERKQQEERAAEARRQEERARLAAAQHEKDLTDSFKAATHKPSVSTETRQLKNACLSGDQTACDQLAAAKKAPAQNKKTEQARRDDEDAKKRESEKKAAQAKPEQDRRAAEEATKKALAACPRLDVEYNLFSHMKMSFDQDVRLVLDHTITSGWKKTRAEIKHGIVRPSIAAWRDDRAASMRFLDWARQVEAGCPGLVDRCGWANPAGIFLSAVETTCTNYDDHELCVQRLNELSADAAKFDTFERCAAGFVDEYRQSLSH